MAHSLLHFSAGMVLGSLSAWPAIMRGVLRKTHLASWMGHWMLLCVGLGCLAILPGLLRRLGLPDSLCDGWWMNVFLFYPLMNKLRSGGLPLAMLALGLVFAVQYGLLLRAIGLRTARGAGRSESLNENTKNK